MPKQLMLLHRHLTPIPPGPIQRYCSSMSRRDFVCWPTKQAPFLWPPLSQHRWGDGIQERIFPHTSLPFSPILCSTQCIAKTWLLLNP